MYVSYWIINLVVAFICMVIGAILWEYAKYKLRGSRAAVENKILEEIARRLGI